MEQPEAFHMLSIFGTHFLSVVPHLFPVNHHERSEKLTSNPVDIDEDCPSRDQA
jgi:hypothetical protein